MANNRRALLNSITDEQLLNTAKAAFTFKDCMKMLGFSTHGGGSSQRMKQRLIALNFDFSKWNKHAYYMKHLGQRKPDEKIFVVGRKNDRTKLKKKLIEHGYKENVCEICGLNGVWNGKKLTLQLHHINGNKYDNRIENLMLLCPNCHTQTDNFSGRKNK